MKKIISLLFCLLLVFNVFVSADSSFYTATEEEASLPKVSARSYVLADALTGEVILCNNENERMPIASTTKVMTCLVALDQAKLDEIVTVDANSCGIEGSSIYLYEGEKLTVQDLLYAIMLESANDAAVCLANHISGSVSDFSELMNQKANDLGLKNTHFNNPHGLEDPEHYSTAADMAHIWCEAMKNDVFSKIVSTKTYRIDLSDGDGYRFLSNHNRLLKTYDSCIGGKTGYTKTAGRCLITGAQRDGAQLVAVTLNDPNDWDDHTSLFEYAFSMYSTVDVAATGTVKHNIAVVGSDKKSVSLSNRDSLSLSVIDVSKLTSSIESPKFLYAPVAQSHTPVARVVYYYNDKEIASLPLYPEEDADVMKKESIFKRFFNFIFN